MRYTCDKSTASPRPCRVRCWLSCTHAHTHLSLYLFCVSPLSLRQHGVRGAENPPRAAAGGARGVADGRRCLEIARARGRRALFARVSRSGSHTSPARKEKGALIHAYDTVQASGKRRHLARRARARPATPARSALTSRAWLCGRAAPALARNTLPPSAPADSPPVC